MLSRPERRGSSPLEVAHRTDGEASRLTGGERRRGCRAIRPARCSGAAGRVADHRSELRLLGVFPRRCSGHRCVRHFRFPRSGEPLAVEVACSRRHRDARRVPRLCVRGRAAAHSRLGRHSSDSVARDRLPAVQADDGSRRIVGKRLGRRTSEPASRFGRVRVHDGEQSHGQDTRRLSHGHDASSPTSLRAEEADHRYCCDRPEGSARRWHPVRKTNRLRRSTRVG